MNSLGLTMIVFGIATKLVTARFCEGGHRCLPPKECCVQGCCYLYAPPSSPRSSSPPPQDHVLNLFFISHWYFWCLVLAVLLALLCVCSIWRKRRQLCGIFCTPSSGGHVHSEGDSAGSCYIPPQYSRCNSFHLNFHAPPPYTEVTAKPDLYPLVFTYTGPNDGSGKSGTNYLMVQYFRNFIVRPAISSSSSLFDSISSENHVPPPYSRATSPDSSGGAIIRSAVTDTTNTYIFPRSISQNNNIITMNDHHGINGNNNNNNINGTNCNDEIKNYSSRSNSVPNTTTTTTILATNHSNNSNTTYSINNNHTTINNNNSSNIHQNNSSHHQNHHQNNNHHTNSNHFMIADLHSTFIPISNSNNSNNSSSNKNNLYNSCNSIISNISTATYSLAFHHAADNINENKKCTLEIENSKGTRTKSSATASGGSVGGNATYANSGGAGSIDSSSDNNLEEIIVLRRSLETCCQLLQQQHQQQRHNINNNTNNKINQQQGSNLYNSSTVSSLANLGSPGSQPQVGTSPTLEVKELLEQIRQFQIHTNNSTIDITATNGVPTTVKLSSYDLAANNAPPKRPSTLQHTKTKSSCYSKPKRGIYLPLSFGGSGGSGASSCGSASNSVNFENVRFSKNHRTSRTHWISKSAPTTPGQPPNNLICDKSPLLVEHEDEEDDIDLNNDVEELS